MADINVTFTHPVDRRSITVTIDDSMTADEAIGKLIAESGIPPHDGGYSLQIKGGHELIGNESLAAAGVKDGATLNIISATDAGKLQEVALWQRNRK